MIQRPYFSIHEMLLRINWTGDYVSCLQTQLHCWQRIWRLGGRQGEALQYRAALALRFQQKGSVGTAIPFIVKMYTLTAHWRPPRDCGNQHVNLPKWKTDSRRCSPSSPRCKARRPGWSGSHPTRDDSPCPGSPEPQQILPINRYKTLQFVYTNPPSINWVRVVGSSRTFTFINFYKVIQPYYSRVYTQLYLYRGQSCTAVSAVTLYSCVQLYVFRTVRCAYLLLKTQVAVPIL